MFTVREFRAFSGVDQIHEATHGKQPLVCKEKVSSNRRLSVWNA